MPEKLKLELLSEIRHWANISNDQEVKNYYWSLFHSLRAVQDPRLAFRQVLKDVALCGGFLLIGTLIGFLIKALYL